MSWLANRRAEARPSGPWLGLGLESGLGLGLGLGFGLGLGLRLGLGIGLGIGLGSPWAPEISSVAASTLLTSGAIPSSQPLAVHWLAA
eukprot:scaffold24087_cov44-Phaeocystis_antarctica.AAC.1